MEDCRNSKNLPAQKFWKKEISEYTNGNFKEIKQQDWDGPIQVFMTIVKPNIYISDKS